MTTTVVPTRDPLFVSPYTDPDVSRYGEVPQALETVIRVAATPAGTGTLVSRETDAAQIVANERTGRQLHALTATTGFVADANVTVAAYSATGPTGYATATSVEIQATGGTAVTRGARWPLGAVTDLSVFGGSAKLRCQVRCTSNTNLNYWALEVQFATTSDFARYGVYSGGTGVVNTWSEAVIVKAYPTVTGGTVDWTKVSAYRFVAVVTGAYTGNLEVRDLRIGTVQTAKTVPDGYLVWEASYDCRTRYRDDATAKASTTLAANSSVAATNVKLTSVTGLAVGDELTIATAGYVETRTITIVGTAGSGGTGVTVSEGYTYAHTSADAVAVYYWGSWSSWITLKVSQPPVVAASTPADAAVLTDPTPDLTHTYSSPSSKVQASRTVRVYERIAGVDQLVYSLDTTGTGLTDTLPRFLLYRSYSATFAWEKTAYDSDGLGTTTARRTFTMNVTTPAVLTSLVATADPITSTVTLGWDASVDANLDHYRVYWQNASGTYIRVDDGPATLLDGQVALVLPAFTDDQNSLGGNSYSVTQHNGYTESDAAFVTVSLDPAPGGSWMIDCPTNGRYTFPIRAVSGSARVTNAAIESFAPPGRGSTIHLNRGITGRTLTIPILYRPTDDGDLSILFQELIDSGTPVWIKGGAGWLWDPHWCVITGVSDSPGVGGMSTLTITAEETDQG